MLNQIRLLVFDLDYLIYDCAAVKTRALRDALAMIADDIPQNVRIPDAIDAEEGFLSRGWRWAETLDVGLGADSLAQLQDAYRDHEVRLAAAGAGKLFPGLTELLSFCRDSGLITTIGAEASRDYLMAVSDRHGLDNFFEMAYCTEEYGVGGPAEMIEEIMSRAEVNPSETVSLGTRAEFFSAARDLAVLTIGCGWGLHELESLSEAHLQATAIAQVYEGISKADQIARHRR